jgi:hypothetical protein
MGYNEAIENQEYEVRTYEAVDGTVPFNEWIKALRDRKGRRIDDA